MLTAIDGQINGGGGVDKFRIKIWSSDGMVYDNQMDALDGDAPTTALGEGSIVIHKDPQALLAGDGTSVGMPGGTLRTVVPSLGSEGRCHSHRRPCVGGGMTGKLTPAAVNE